MDNYKKGKNVEEPFDPLQVLIPDIPENVLIMQVRGGSKIRNLLEYALNHFPDSKTVLWIGVGPSVGKAITCAEIMKREYKNHLYQITKICYRNVDEYWDPIIPELDQLVVKRRLPMIQICLSLDKLNDTELGYQAPDEKINFKSQQNNDRSNIRQHHKEHSL